MTIEEMATMIKQAATSIKNYDENPKAFSDPHGIMGNLVLSLEAHPEPLPPEVQSDIEVVKRVMANPDFRAK